MCKSKNRDWKIKDLADFLIKYPQTREFNEKLCVIRGCSEPQQFVYTCDCMGLCEEHQKKVWKILGTYCF